MKVPICKMCKSAVATHYSPYALEYGSGKEPFDACEECDKAVREVIF